MSNTIVFRKGYVGKTVKYLEDDVRMIMEPNVSRRLKERRWNTLRDFVDVAGALHVGQLVCLSATDVGLYMRLIRVPSGPTVTFRVSEYTLMRDFARQGVGAAPSPLELQTGPLLILSNFKTVAGGAEQRQLLIQLFQQMFPMIDPETTQLSQCRRIVLVAHDQGAFHVRHYKIVTSAARPLVRGIQIGNRLPDLSNLTDISEYLLGPEGDQGEERGDNKNNEGGGVPDQADDGEPATPSSSASSAARVKLVELGPRLSLELHKIEEGVSNGRVLFHRLISKSAKEVAEQESHRRAREELRAQRKAEQELNVQKKRSKQKQSSATKEKGEDNEDDNEEEEEEEDDDEEEDNDDDHDEEEEHDDADNDNDDDEKVQQPSIKRRKK